MKKYEKKILSRQKIEGKRKRTVAFSLVFLTLFGCLFFLLYSPNRLPLLSPPITALFRYLSPTVTKEEALGPISLGELADFMRKKENVSVFHVYQSAPKTMTILQRKRTPLYALTQAPKTYLMTDGSICHLHTFSIPSNPSLPILMGLATPSDLSVQNPCHAPTATTKRIRTETQLLTRLAKNAAVGISTFSYHAERGYSLLLQPSESLIHIGFPPFQKKMARLYQILQKNPKKSLQVDLDFENKAFIKEVDVKI